MLRNIRSCLLAVVVSLFMLCPTLLPAQSKIGYVDIDRVTEKARAVNEGMKKVGEKIKKVQAQLNEKKEKLRALQEEISKSEGVLSREEQDKKRKEANTLRNEIDDLDIQTRRDMQRLDDEFFQPMLKKIVWAIQDVAKERKMDMIVRGEAVLYGHDSVDISEDVIKKLNVSDSEDEASTSTRTTKKTDGAAPKEKSSETESPARTPRPIVATPETEAVPDPTPAVRTPLRQEMGATPRPAVTRPAGTRPVDRQPE